MTPEPQAEPRVGWTPADLPQVVRRRRPSWWRRIGRGGRFVESWVPEPLRDARVDPGRRGALVLSVVAALAAVAAAVGVWRDRPEPRPVQTISQQAAVAGSSGSPVDGTVARSRSRAAAGASEESSADAAESSRVSPTGPGGVPSTHPPAVLAVSVTGAVRRPGLVRVPTGSRVADAIAAAGGITPAGDITGLNVATVLSDGDSVVVGTAGSSTGPGSGTVAGTSGRSPSGTANAPPSGPPAGLLDLNSADSAALEQLPGVGPVMAGNIIAWREANGPFSSVEQLQEITGIGPARYAQLAPLVTIG